MRFDRDDVDVDGLRQSGPDRFTDHGVEKHDASAQRDRSRTETRDHHASETRKLFAGLAENSLRRQFNMTCQKGVEGSFFTLSPSRPPAVEHLAFRKLESDRVLMVSPTGAPAGVSCR